MKDKKWVNLSNFEQFWIEMSQIEILSWYESNWDFELKSVEMSQIEILSRKESNWGGIQHQLNIESNWDFYLVEMSQIVILSRNESNWVQKTRNE